MYAIATPEPDAAIILNPTATDHDGDGVADTTDNCPNTVNPDQGNEDKDSFGDACDLCPQFSDSPAVDTDQDGIGDACDPNPAVKDTVWLFEGFHKGQPWQGSSNWAPVGDQIQATARGNNGDLNEYLIVPLTRTGRVFDNFGIMSSIQVQQMTGNSNSHEIGVDVYDSKQNKDVFCELYQDNQGGLLILSDGTQTGLNKTTNFSWSLNTTYNLKMVRKGQAYTCSVINSTATLASVTGNSNVVPQDGIATEIWAWGVTAQFASVFVVGP